MCLISLSRSLLMRVRVCSKLQFLIIVLFALRVCNAFSDSALINAERLANEGKYYSAITEYKRYMFFNPECKSYALYKIGILYRKMQEWQKAIDNLSESVSYEKDKKVAEEKRIILGTTLIASGNYNLARLEFIKVYEYSEFNMNRLRALYFSGIAEVYAYDWDSANESFRRYYSECDPSKIQKIESILDDVRNSYKSIRLAQIFSTIIPGTGQIYAGDMRNGINAFVLNGMLIFFTINSLNKKDYKDALLISSVLLYRYYTGNIYHAGEAVRRYNNEVNRNVSKKILQIVSENEPLSGGN